MLAWFRKSGNALDANMEFPADKRVEHPPWMPMAGHIEKVTTSTLQSDLRSLLIGAQA